MRGLIINKVKFYYASYMDKTEIVDEYGNITGEYKINYTNPVECRANISSIQGETKIRQFGVTESYDKVIVLNEKNAPINEHSILWVDTLPTLNEDGTTATPHDYVVTKVAKSLNVTLVGIRKVTVNG